MLRSRASMWLNWESRLMNQNSDCICIRAPILHYELQANSINRTVWIMFFYAPALMTADNTTGVSLMLLYDLLLSCRPSPSMTSSFHSLWGNMVFYIIPFRFRVRGFAGFTIFRYPNETLYMDGVSVYAQFWVAETGSTQAQAALICPNCMSTWWYTTRVDRIYLDGS